MLSTKQRDRLEWATTKYGEEHVTEARIEVMLDLEDADFHVNRAKETLVALGMDTTELAQVHEALKAARRNLG